MPSLLSIAIVVATDQFVALRIARHPRATRSQRIVMLTGPKGTEKDSVAPCSVCGHIQELFELPGRTEKCCLECSADLATAILLSTEIDAATLAGRSTNALVCEFSEISNRMLERSQSAELGNG